MLTLSDLLKGNYEQRVIKLVRQRLIWMYGSYGRFNSLDTVDFSFTREALVISFAPVDEKGWYLNVYRVDVPIPLTSLREYLSDSKIFQ